MIYKLRTVDIWDTVLRRKCHPDAVKLETARKLAAYRSTNLRAQFQNIQELLKLRCSVEGQLARASALDPERDDEYTLHQVLSEWIKQAAFIDQAVIGLVVEELAREELAHEDFVCYVDNGIRDLLPKHPAERTVFLSDFYMPATSIFFLLRQKNIADLFDAGHSSCDHGINKRSGRLFGLLHGLYQVEPQEHLHIGDNEVSDYQVPQRLGIAAIHYKSESERGLQKIRTGMFNDRQGLYAEIDGRCRQSAALLSSDSQGEAYRYGISLAPLFAGFALFILESVERDRPEKLFFFTREGEFFIKVYDRLRAACPQRGRALPEAGLLPVSRMATFAASLKEVSTIEMMRLWNLYSTQSLQAWGQSLGLDTRLVSNWCARYGIESAAAIRYPWLDDRVQKLFSAPDIKTVLESFVAGKRSVLFEFLESNGLSATNRKVSIVDIGWRGTIQDNLSLLMPETFFAGIYLGLQKFLNPQPKNCSKTAFGPDLNQSDGSPEFFSNLPLLEMLTNSPHGSVMGYQRDPNGMVGSVRLIDERENAIFHELVMHIQDGILSGVQTWAEYIHVHAVTSAELRDVSLKLWRTTVADPPKFLAKGLARLNHNELFGTGTFMQVKRPQRFSSVVKLFTRNRSRYI